MLTRSKLFGAFLVFALSIIPILSSSDIANATEPEIYVAGTQTGIDGDDVSQCNLPIGFTFNFYGVDNTSICQNINGTLNFSDFYLYANSSLTTSSTAGMYAFWDDLNTNATGLASLRYATTGTAPNRKFIAQWTNIYFHATTVQLGTFQIVLFETSNKIQFQYRDILGSDRANGSSATVGIASSLQALQYSSNTASLTQGQAISFTPSTTSNYTMNSAATYDPLYVTLPGEPSQAVLANPPDGATGVTTSPAFEWNAAPGATS